jgi:hypothetical protein
LVRVLGMKSSWKLLFDLSVKQDSGLFPDRAQESEWRTRKSRRTAGSYGSNSIASRLGLFPRTRRSVLNRLAGRGCNAVSVCDIYWVSLKYGGTGRPNSDATVQAVSRKRVLPQPVSEEILAAVRAPRARHSYFGNQEKDNPELGKPGARSVAQQRLAEATSKTLAGSPPTRANTLARRARRRRSHARRYGSASTSNGAR